MTENNFILSNPYVINKLGTQLTEDFKQLSLLVHNKTERIRLHFKDDQPDNVNLTKIVQNYICRQFNNKMTTILAPIEFTQSFSGVRFSIIFNTAPNNDDRVNYNGSHPSTHDRFKNAVKYQILANLDKKVVSEITNISEITSESICDFCKVPFNVNEMFNDQPCSVVENPKVAAFKEYLSNLFTIFAAKLLKYVNNEITYNYSVNREGVSAEMHEYNPICALYNYNYILDEVDKLDECERTDENIIKIYSDPLATGVLRQMSKAIIADICSGNFNVIDINGQTKPINIDNENKAENAFFTPEYINMLIDEYTKKYSKAPTIKELNEYYRERNKEHLNALLERDIYLYMQNIITDGALRKLIERNGLVDKMNIKVRVIVKGDEQHTNSTNINDLFK